MSVNMDDLVEGVKRDHHSCATVKKVREVPEALEFLQKVTELSQTGTEISPLKVVDALKENWELVMCSRRVSEHLRGRCSCKPED